MPTRSSFRSSSRSWSKPSYKSPTLTVKKKTTSSWFSKKPVTKKTVIVNKTYNNGYTPYVTPVVIGGGTTAVVHHYDDDYQQPYQDNGMSGYGFMAFVLTLAVICAAGFMLFRRFA